MRKETEKAAVLEETTIIHWKRMQLNSCSHSRMGFGLNIFRDHAIGPSPRLPEPVHLLLVIGNFGHVHHNNKEHSSDLEGHRSPSKPDNLHRLMAMYQLCLSVSLDPSHWM